MKVAILGASPKPERYANKAMQRLLEYGHEVELVNPAYDRIDGYPVRKSLAELKGDGIDTVTVYLNPHRVTVEGLALMGLRPRRVIFNPGAENRMLQSALAQEGIEVVEGCTLVMLQTGQF